VVDRVVARLGTRVDEHADVGLQHATKGLEEPTMGVDLLLVLLLQAEEHLHGLLLGNQLDDVVLDHHADLSGVFVNVGRDVLAVDLLLGDTLLVHTHTREKSPRTGVDLSATIANDTHNNLLPGVFAPRLALGTLAHVLDVLEHANHGPGKENLVLVVHCNDDEELRVSRLAEELLAKSEVALVEFGRVASRRRVAHVREFITLAVGQLVQKLGRDRAVEDQVSPIQQDLLDRHRPLDWRRAGPLLGIIMIWLVYMRIMRYHRSPIIVVVALVVSLVRSRLVWLVIIGIMVRFRVD
jgi:hypothetical protein